MGEGGTVAAIITTVLTFLNGYFLYRSKNKELELQEGKDGYSSYQAGVELARTVMKDVRTELEAEFHRRLDDLQKEIELCRESYEVQIQSLKSRILELEKQNARPGI